MIRAALALIAAATLAACASGAARPSRDTLADERAEDAVKRMQDEFNTLTGDAF